MSELDLIIDSLADGDLTAKEAKTQLTELVASEQRKARIETLERTFCCCAPPVVGEEADGIDICGADHVKQIKELKEEEIANE